MMCYAILIGAILILSYWISQLYADIRYMNRVKNIEHIAANKYAEAYLVYHKELTHSETLNANLKVAMDNNDTAKTIEYEKLLTESKQNIDMYRDIVISYQKMFKE